MPTRPLEPQFYDRFREILGLGGDADQHGDAPRLRRRIAAAFLTGTRDDWCARFEGSDACVTPVLSMTEAPRHPHTSARGTFVDLHERLQPAPAPRFSQTPGAIQGPAPTRGADAEAVLRDRLGRRPPNVTVHKMR